MQNVNDDQLRRAAQTFKSSATTGLYLHGGVSILMGLILVIFPAPSLVVLALFFAAWLCVSGVVTLIAWWRKRRRGAFGLLVGIALLLAGGIAALAPETLIVAVAIMLSTIAVFVGIGLGMLTISMFRARVALWPLSLLSSIVCLAFAILLFLNTNDTIVGLIWVLGIFAIVQGVAAILLAFKLSRLQLPARFGENPNNTLAGEEA